MLNIIDSFYILYIKIKIKVKGENYVDKKIYYLQTYQ